MHGAHGSKCFFLLRGLARVLMPEDDPVNPGAVRYRYDADLGPGEVGKREGRLGQGFSSALNAGLFSIVFFSWLRSFNV